MTEEHLEEAGRGGKKFGLSIKEKFFQAIWIADENLISIRLRLIWPPSLIGDTIWFYAFSLSHSILYCIISQCMIMLFYNVCILLFHSACAVLFLQCVKCVVLQCVIMVPLDSVNLFG